MSLDFRGWANREYSEELHCLDDLKKMAGDEKAQNHVTDRQAFSFLQDKIAEMELSSEELKKLGAKGKLLKKAIVERQKEKADKALPIVGMIYYRIIKETQKSNQLLKIDSQLLRSLQTKYEAALNAEDKEQFCTQMCALLPVMLPHLLPHERKMLLQNLFDSKYCTDLMGHLVASPECVMHLFEAGLLYKACATQQGKFSPDAKTAIRSGIELAHKLKRYLLIPAQKLPEGFFYFETPTIFSATKDFLDRTIGETSFEAIASKLGYEAKDARHELKAYVTAKLLAQWQKYPEKALRIDIPKSSVSRKGIEESQLNRFEIPAQGALAPDKAFTLDMLRVVAKEPSKPLTRKEIDNWVWKKLSHIGWVERLAEKRILHNILAKDTLTLTTTESIAALKVILKWMKAEPLLPHQLNFIQQLHEKGYLQVVTPPPVNELTQYLRQLEGRSFTYENVPSIHPKLLYPQKRDELLQFSEEEMAAMLRFADIEKVLDTTVDPTKSFQILIDILHDPERLAKFVSLGSLKRNEPFLLGSNIVSWDSPLLRERLGCPQEKWLPAARVFEDRMALLSQRLRKPAQRDVIDIIERAQLSLLVSRNLDRIVEENLTSQEAKAALQWVKKCPYNLPGYNPLHQLPDWVNVESHLQEIKSLRERIQGNPNSLNLHELILFQTATTLARQYRGFFAKNSHWPSAAFQEVQAWLQLMPSEETSYLGYLNQALAKSIESGQMDAILEKISKCVMGKTIQPENRLSYAEFRLYRKLTEILPHYQNVIDFRGLPDFAQYEKLLASHTGERFIRVCLSRSNPEKEEQLNSPDISLTKRMKIIGWLILRKAVQCVFPYSHANFLLFDGQNFTTHGLGGEGIYHEEISARFSPGIATYDIDPTALMPPNLSEQDQVRFKELFWQNLQQIISKEREGVVSYPESPLKRFLKGNLLPGTAKPVDLFLERNENREMFCSEFVFQSIVEAQVKTCEEMKLASPKDLSFFGLRSLDGLSPGGLESILRAKKILKSLPNPGLAKS
jgi:hypothetical protein